MAPILPPEQQVINEEVRGFTYKQFAWFIGAIMTVEFTVAGMWFSINNRIAQVSQKEETHDAQIKAQEDKITGLRLDMDVLKIHDAKADAQIDNLRMRFPYPSK